MSIVEVVMRVAGADEEIAVAHLIEFSPAGFRCDPREDGRTELGVYVEAATAPTVLAFLARAGVEVDHVADVPVPDDYAERWKEFHKPVLVGGMWVGPPWLVDEAPADARRVVIEPAQGFGTGAHPTTRLVLSLLPAQPRASVLDVGCGSGVLSIAAAQLGFRPITAIDNDALAIESTRANLERNGVHPTTVTVRRADALADALPRADIVLANLTLEPLQELAPRVKAPRVIASGLLRSQVGAATAAFEQSGYVVRERRDRDGWVALVLDSAVEESATMYHRPVF